jgi:hypothetical protein
LPAIDVSEAHWACIHRAAEKVSSRKVALGFSEWHHA